MAADFGEEMVSEETALAPHIEENHQPENRILHDITNWERQRTDFGHMLVSTHGDVLINADKVQILFDMIESLKTSKVYQNQLTFIHHQPRFFLHQLLALDKVNKERLKALQYFRTFE